MAGRLKIWNAAMSTWDYAGGGSQTVVVQADDPGAIGPGNIWVDTTTDPPTVNVRNSDDDGWALSFNGGGEITNGVSIRPDADTGFALAVQQAEGGTFEIVNVRDDDGGYLLLIDKTSIGIAGTEALPANVVMTVADGVRITGDTVNNTWGVQVKPNGSGSSPLVGFFGHTPVARPTGVTVDAAAIHAALVSLGLITA